MYSGGRTVDEHTFVGDTFLRSASRIHRLQLEYLAAMAEPLTLPQFRTLQRVLEGYTSPSDLSKLANRSLPTTVETIDGLVRRGLLSRTPSAADRRAVTLSLTPRGRAVLDAGIGELARLYDDVFTGLTTTERAQLERIMAKIHGLSESWLKID